MDIDRQSATELSTTSPQTRDPGWLRLAGGSALLLSAGVSAALGALFLRENWFFAIAVWMFGADIASHGVKLVEAVFKGETGEPTPESFDMRIAWQRLAAGVLLLIAGGVAAGPLTWLFRNEFFFSYGALFFGGATAHQGARMVQGAISGELPEDEEETEEETDEVTSADEASSKSEPVRELTLAMIQKLVKNDLCFSLSTGAKIGIGGSVIAATLGMAGNMLSWNGWHWALKLGLWGTGGITVMIAGLLAIQTVREWSKLDDYHLDAEIADACKEVGLATAEISAPLDRVLTAYAAMREMSGDVAWKRAKLPVKKYMQEARAQLLNLLNRGAHLGKVASMLKRRQAGPPSEHYEKLADACNRSLDQSRGAAEMFERAQAEMSRALLATTSSSATVPSLAQAPMEEMRATFGALAESLESIDPMTSLPPAILDSRRASLAQRQETPAQR